MENNIYTFQYTHAIFLHVQMFILSKLDKSSNSMVCTSKQELEFGTTLWFRQKIPSTPKQQNSNSKPIHFHPGFGISCPIQFHDQFTASKHSVREKKRKKNYFNLKKRQWTGLLNRNHKCPSIISQLMLILRPLHLLLFLTLILETTRLKQKIMLR